VQDNNTLPILVIKLSKGLKNFKNEYQIRDFLLLKAVLEFN
jgi:hypothetical protein